MRPPPISTAAALWTEGGSPADTIRVSPSRGVAGRDAADASAVNVGGGGTEGPSVKAATKAATTPAMERRDQALLSSELIEASVYIPGFVR